MIDGEEVTESYASQLTGDPAYIGNLEMVQSYVLVIWHLFWQWLKHPANHSLVFARLQNNFFVRAHYASVRRAPCICSPKPVLDV